MTAKVIDIKNVAFSYGKNRVFEKLQLVVKSGTFIAITGPNGAGKSTLLRLIAGTLHPSHGTIKVNKSEASSRPPRDRAKLVAMVSQNPQLPANSTVQDTVLMGRNPYIGILGSETKADFEIALESMHRTGIAALCNRTINQLSGGERQRVALAMALAQKTPIILLDEPTSNLDLAHQPAALSMFKKITEGGRTVVAAIHDLTLAAQFSHEVALIGDGYCQQVGPPAKVITEKNIYQAYGATVRIFSHPDSNMPVVVNST